MARIQQFVLKKPHVQLGECCLRPPSTSTGATGLLAAKLAEADKIEGYPDLYSRTVATVLTDKGVTSPAYVYHRTGKFDRASRQRIADGDWLSRKR